MTVKIATWNINSVRLRAPLVERFLTAETPDILCLQETKSPVENIPAEVFEALGYMATWTLLIWGRGVFQMQVRGAGSGIGDRQGLVYGCSLNPIPFTRNVFRLGLPRPFQNLNSCLKLNSRGGHRYRNLETATASFRNLSYPKRNRSSETLLQIVKPQLATPQLRNRPIGKFWVNGRI